LVGTNVGSTRPATNHAAMRLRGAAVRAAICPPALRLEIERVAANRVEREQDLHLVLAQEERVDLLQHATPGLSVGPSSDRRPRKGRDRRE